MDSLGTLVSDTHSLLLSPPDTSSQAAGRNTKKRAGNYGFVDIWRNLILLSEGNQKQPDKDDKRGRLRYYKQQDFVESPGEPLFLIGSGVSFTVTRRRVAAPSQDSDNPNLLAVKTLNLPKQSRHGEHNASQAKDMTANVVLKELRLLTHPPLRDHDNIVTLLGYHSDHADSQELDTQRRGQSGIALVMEYAPHGILSDFLAFSVFSGVRSLGLNMKVHFMTDITRGLKALHDCGVAHSDMKLENTLVFPDKQHGYMVKLSDFGNSLLDLERRQRYCGTPFRSPPEVRRTCEDDGLLDASGIFKCDIFALGLMIWEIMIDGSRFTNVIGGSLRLIADEDCGLVEALNRLPRDELLLHALICSHEYEEEDAALYQVVRDALQLTLPEDPDARGFADDVIAALSGRGIILRKDHIRSNIGTNRPEPLPASTPLLLDPNRHVRLNYASLRSLPLVVREELIALLEDKAIDSAASQEERGNAKYDLAMCMVSGVQTSSVSLKSASKQLEGAAGLGSPDALSVIFRLYDALSFKTPQSLRDSPHPIAVADRNLRVRDESAASSYMTQRIIECERLYQHEALQCDFEVLCGGECLMISRLVDLIPRLVNCHTIYGPEDLECVPCGKIMGMRGSQVKLLHLAARLNLDTLVKFLLAPRPNSPAPSKIHDYMVLSHDFLSSACEGGHLSMLMWICEQKFAIHVLRSTTLFHWLVKFSAEDAKVAMNILLNAASWALAACDTGREIYGARLQGTALEFAITTDNLSLVETFLEVKNYVKTGDPFQAIGWTSSTFDTAVSLNLWRLIPILAPIEREFRITRPNLTSEVRYRLSQGNPPLHPFGLFRMGVLNDPTLPFIIHGKSYSKAVDKTIDAVLNAGLCTINDTDRDGRTALSHALHSVLCDFTLELLRRMISKGAKLSPREDALKTLTQLLETRSDRTSRAILRLLLKAGIYKPVDGFLLGYSIHFGNLEAVRMLCGLDSDGTRLPVTFAVQENVGDRASRSLLTAAITARKNNAEMIKLLLKMGISINYEAEKPGNDDDDVSLRHPLEEALVELHSDFGTIDALIEGGSHLSWGDKNIIIIAALRGSFWVHGEHVMRLLLRYPRVQALKDVEWSKYGTPLAIACHCGNYGAVYALHDAGANLGDVDNIEFLCALASTVTQDPRTLPQQLRPIRLDSPKALRQWRYQMEGLLYFLRKERGIVQGRTRLHFAVETGNLERAMELIEADSRLVSVRDDLGRLPIDLMNEYKASLHAEDPALNNIIAVARVMSATLAREESTSQDGRIEDSGDDYRRRRLMRFAPVSLLGWDFDEVLLTGQSLLPFRRRYLFDKEFMAPGKPKPVDSSVHNSLGMLPQHDSMLVLDDRHHAELGIIMAQLATQAAADFRDDPEKSIMAQLRAVHARLTRESSHLSETRSRLHELLGQCRASFGANHAITISCGILLSDASLYDGDTNGSITLLRQIADILKGVRGPTHVQTRLVAEHLCTVLLFAQRFEEANAQALMHLKLTQATPDITPESISNAYMLIGDSLMGRGDFEAVQRKARSAGAEWFHRAIEAFKSALEKSTDDSGTQNEQSCQISLQLAKAYFCVGEFGQGRALCKMILEEGIRIRSVMMDMITSTAQRLLVMWDVKDEDIDREILRLEQVLDLIYTYQNENVDGLDDTLSPLIATYSRAGRHDEAAQLLHRLITLRTHTFGANHFHTLNTKSDAIAFFMKAEMWEAVESMIRDLLKHVEEQEAESLVSSWTCTLVECVALSCVKQGKLAEAVGMYCRALAIRMALGASEEMAGASVMLALSDILVRQRSPDDAEKWAIKALEVCKANGTEGEKKIVRCYDLLGKIFRARGRHADAIACQVEILQRKPEAIGTRISLMYHHSRTGGRVEARKYGSEAWALFLTSRNTDSYPWPQDAAMLLCELASNYLKIGDYRESKNMAEEALKECTLPDGSSSLPIRKTKLQVLNTLREALEHLGEEARLSEVLKEAYDLETSLAGLESGVTKA